MTINNFDAVKEYKEYYRNGDRREIFKLLVDRYGIQNALYPGSYIHIAPSFYIPETVYIDSNEKARKFFDDRNIVEFISKHSHYKKFPLVRYYNYNYNLDFGEKSENFDLLISLYAGFVSQACKKYIKKDGILLVNNTHGDASMAYIDEEYEFIARIYRSNNRYRLTNKNLDKYFIPKNPKLELTKDYMRRIKRGVGYTKTSIAYVFKRV
jgi:hypothetical protein